MSTEDEGATTHGDRPTFVLLKGAAPPWRERISSCPICARVLRSDECGCPDDCLRRAFVQPGMPPAPSTPA